MSKKSLLVCVCVCAYVCVRVRLSVCVRERERLAATLWSCTLHNECHLSLMQALMTSRTKGNVEEADTCARGVHSMASCTNFADEVAGSGRHYSLQQSPQKLTEKDNPHFIPGKALHSITLTGSDCTAHRTEIISSECFITLSDDLKLHPQSHLPLSLLLSLSTSSGQIH